MSGHPDKPWQSEQPALRVQRQLLRKMPTKLLSDKYIYLMKCVTWLGISFVNIGAAPFFVVILAIFSEGTRLLRTRT